MAEPFLRIVDKDSNTEVLRITATEIVVDPNVSVDDAARRVIEALQGYFNLAAEEQASRIRAEALEEAAKLAEAKGDEWATVWRNRFKADQHMEGKSAGADEIAAAIRAMIPKEKQDADKA